MIKNTPREQIFAQTTNPIGSARQRRYPPGRFKFRTHFIALWSQITIRYIDKRNTSRKYAGNLISCYYVILNANLQTYSEMMALKPVGTCLIMLNATIKK